MSDLSFLKSKKLSDEQKGILAIVEMNKNEKRKEIKKTVIIGRLRVTFHWQSKKSFWGRFGGGWNWILGFEASGSTLILNLLVCSLRFYIAKAEGRTP